VLKAALVPLNMNSTNETLLFDRFLIMYNLCFDLYYLYFYISLYTCANVICIKLLLTYLLTYTHTPCKQIQPLSRVKNATWS